MTCVMTVRNVNITNSSYRRSLLSGGSEVAVLVLVGVSASFHSGLRCRHTGFSFAFQLPTAVPC